MNPLAFLAPRASAFALVCAALFALGGLLVWLALGKVDNMVSDARDHAIAERDAHWTAQIEKSNALAEMRAAEQARNARDAEIAANERVRVAEDQIEEMERKNALLPDGDGHGLGRDRVRLLPN